MERRELAEKKILEEMEEELRLISRQRTSLDRRENTGASLSRKGCHSSFATDIVIAACATNHKLSLEHCDSHFDQSPAHRGKIVIRRG
jgi:predicted nucleic acid-binding protein